MDDVKSVTDPLSKVKAGLHGGGAAVPLQAVHVRAKLMDLAAQVQVNMHILGGLWNEISINCFVS